MSMRTKQELSPAALETQTPGQPMEVTGISIFPVSSFLSCVTLDKPFNACEPQFLHLSNRYYYYQPPKAAQRRKVHQEVPGTGSGAAGGEQTAGVILIITEQDGPLPCLGLRVTSTSSSGASSWGHLNICPWMG